MKEKRLTFSQASSPRPLVLPKSRAAIMLGIAVGLFIFFNLLFRALGFQPGNDSFPDGKTITVLALNAQTNFYLDKSGNPSGFAHDLISAFAQSHSLDIKYRSFNSQEEILAELKLGHGDLAVGNFTLPNYEDEDQFLNGPSYGVINTELICHSQIKPKDVKDLSNIVIHVAYGSSEEQSLKNIREDRADLRWMTVTNVTQEQILQAVNQGRIDCTITDETTMKYYRRVFLNLRTRATLGEHTILNWLLPKRSYLLSSLLKRWFLDVKYSNIMKRLLERYFGHIDDFDYADIKLFLERCKQILPIYENVFADVASETHIDWRLLAAVAYQESHWNPLARSRTGVRGLMMLTEDTADFLGVEDRTDPHESIRGGARYLRYIIDKIPSTIPERERMWIALAAYNIGIGHVRDAGRLALRLDKKPEFWHDLKQVLPLLTQKKHYQNLKHGYARGYEPVNFVDRIRNYYEVLTELYPN